MANAAVIPGAVTESNNKPNVWLWNPAVDLIIGCGAWSAPLVMLVYPLQWSSVEKLSVFFYAFALVCNYPHFMATIYRAYHTREDFEKYRIFTVHITGLMLLAGLLSHLNFALLPWLFTIYITWSPWHYSGQNYGLLMMFVRRNGITPTDLERNLLWSAFLCSYLMLFLNFHSGPSNDPLVLSLGLPIALSKLGRIILSFAYLGMGIYVLASFVQRSGWRAMTAPITIFFTQLIWFLLPSLLELFYNVQIPRTRYSSGILAVMHSAQYLWVTSYFQKREAIAGESRPWRPWAYAGTLIAGGVALFVAGPWAVSWTTHYDLTASFLIFTAMVNIHHFILDGALWKLREGKIATLLLNTRSAVENGGRKAGGAISGASEWLAGPALGAKWVRYGVAALLIALGALDSYRYSESVAFKDTSHIQAALKLDPYDMASLTLLSQADIREGKLSKAEEALRMAVAVNPQNPMPMQNLGRYLVSNKKYDEAYGHYKSMVAHLPNDPNALINLGILAQKLGRNEEAVSAWTKATEVSPRHPYAHLYLADELYDENKILEALPHYEIFLNIYTHIRVGNEPGGDYSQSSEGVQADAQANSLVAPAPERVSMALLKAADGQLLRGNTQLAMGYLQESALLAQKVHASIQENVAQAKLAVLYDATGHLHDAFLIYRRAIALRDAVGDPQAEARDWRDYGDFLLRHGAQAKYGYACLVKAEHLLQTAPPPAENPAVYPGQRNVRPTFPVQNVKKDYSVDLAKYTTERVAAERNLGSAVSVVRQNLDSTLTEAITLPYEQILPLQKEFQTNIQASQSPTNPVKGH